MANSTSATCFLVVVMAIIVCLSMLVGIKGFSRQGDNQLLQDAEMYARTFSNEGFEDDPEADLDLEPLEEAFEDTEGMETEDDTDGAMDGAEAFQSRPMVASGSAGPVDPATHADIIPFDGTEMQTFGSIAL